MVNEIIVKASGNTYCGVLAQRVMYAHSKSEGLAAKYSAYKLPTRFQLSKDDVFMVYEFMGDRMVCRAQQTTREGALKYMTSDNRILIDLSEEAQA